MAPELRSPLPADVTWSAYQTPNVREKSELGEPSPRPRPVLSTTYLSSHAMPLRFRGGINYVLYLSVTVLEACTLAAPPTSARLAGLFWGKLINELLPTSVLRETLGDNVMPQVAPFVKSAKTYKLAAQKRRRKCEMFTSSPILKRHLSLPACLE